MQALLLVAAWTLPVLKLICLASQLAFALSDSTAKT
jgi:hypothetical protein